jgi:hypothetical protein
MFRVLSQAHIVKKIYNQFIKTKSYHMLNLPETQYTILFKINVLDVIVNQVAFFEHQYCMLQQL